MIIIDKTLQIASKAYEGQKGKFFKTMKTITLIASLLLISSLTAFILMQREQASLQPRLRKQCSKQRESDLRYEISYCFLFF